MNLETLAGVVVGGVLGFVGTWLADRRHRKQAAHDARVKDLDETRRLLLMIDLLLEHSHPVPAELTATVAHALAKHSELLTDDEAARFGSELMSANGSSSDARVKLRSEVAGLIAEIDQALRS